MKITVPVMFALIVALALPSMALAQDPSGKTLYRKYCNMCHPNGGNIMKPGFGLHKADLEKNGVKTEKDIIDKMRHPGTGMPAFSKDKISDSDADAIADYIMKTFK
ncbi:MAG: c-type cytochrome [Nitrospiraceae bacterium]|nr:c-type cytochrome [Nitrospiraceae bacterium]